MAYFILGVISAVLAAWAVGKYERWREKRLLEKHFAPGAGLDYPSRRDDS